MLLSGKENVNVLICYLLEVSHRTNVFAFFLENEKRGRDMEAVIKTGLLLASIQLAEKETN